MDFKHLYQESVCLLTQLIAAPSTSRNEAPAADVMEHFLQQNSLPYQRVGHNFICRDPHHDDARPTLLLNAHIDTVKPVAAWTLNPFEPTVKDGKLYGLGSNDDGASLVTLLQLYRLLTSTPQPYNVIWVASAEEEVSGKEGMERIVPQLPHIDVALVGEPTQMQPAVAEKGLMVLDVTIHGKAGHAARNEGVNAIYKAMDAVSWFRTHQFEKTSPLLGAVKTTVTIIQAGTQHNVVPDACQFTVDVRSNECYSNQELYQAICQHIEGDVKARSFRLNSSSIPMEHPLIRKAIQMGRQPFGSPTLSDQALMPFPSFKMGPGDSRRSHTANEYIELRELEEALPLYVELLNGTDIRL